MQPAKTARGTRPGPSSKIFTTISRPSISWPREWFGRRRKQSALLEIVAASISLPQDWFRRRRNQSPPREIAGRVTSLAVCMIAADCMIVGQEVRARRRSSKQTTAAALETLSDSTLAAMGIDTHVSTSSATSCETP